MKRNVFMWCSIGLWVASCVASARPVAEPCPDRWSAQRHLIEISKIASLFRDGIDRVYITYTRADMHSRIDDLAASRVFDMQSFLTNQLQAVQLNAWQASESLRDAHPITSRHVALACADYLLAQVASALDRIERYEYYTGNMYDSISTLARKSVLVHTSTEIGARYGATFSPLLQSLRGELNEATQALYHLKRCGP